MLRAAALRLLRRLPLSAPAPPPLRRSAVATAGSTHAAAGSSPTAAGPTTTPLPPPTTNTIPIQPQNPSRLASSCAAVAKWADTPAKPALLLGFAGALPFVAGTVAFVTLPEPYCDKALVCQKYYGATILSFLGAVHWGLALHTPLPVGKPPLQLRQAVVALFTPLSSAQAWRAFTYAVTPSLVSWFALMVPSHILGLSTLFCGLGAALAYDIATLRKIAPPWYLSLRLALSAIAMTSIALNIHASGVFRAARDAREAAMTEAERRFAHKLKGK